MGGLDKVKIGAMDEKDYSDSIKYWLVQCDKNYDYSPDEGQTWRDFLPANESWANDLES